MDHRMDQEETDWVKEAEKYLKEVCNWQPLNQEDAHIRAIIQGLLDVINEFEFGEEER